MNCQRTFEGPDLRELLDHVQQTCSSEAQILEANRRRRGGWAGFFAREIFEVTVSDPLDLTVESPESTPIWVDTTHSPLATPAVASMVAASCPQGTARPFSSHFADVLAEALDGMEEGEVTPEADAFVRLPPDRAAVAPVESSGSRRPLPRAVPTPADHPPTLASVPAPAAKTSIATINECVERTGDGPSAEMSLRPPRSIREDVWTMLDRYAALPTADLRSALADGPIAVIGKWRTALPVAVCLARLAGCDESSVLVASSGPCPDLPDWRLLPDPTAAAERMMLNTSLARRLVVVVDVDHENSRLGWARRVVHALGAGARHLVVPANRAVIDVRLTAHVFQATALDLVGLDDTIDPESLCELGLPITTLEGRPADPGTWVALSLERRCDAAI